jgi:aspartokinase/homoserine dehydrogenase 1
MTRPRLEVWKLGGAALADAPAIARAVGLVRSHPGPLTVVVSALAGITDGLLDGAARSAGGDTAAGAEVARLFRRRHRALVTRLVRAGRPRARLLATVDAATEEYRDLCRAVLSLADLPPRASDMLVARGERTATSLFAAALSAAGRPAVEVDAAGLVMTDGVYGRAAPDLRLTRERARRVLLPLLRAGATPVVPGFIGSGPDGSLTTLGRGGTDLTATVLARCLGARRVVLWKDVPGILTADPRDVPDARLIPQLHHREAAEVAHYGAKVLHPRALIPIDGSRVVLHVRSFLDPAGPGTEVSGRRTLPKYPVKALATISGQSLVTVAGKGMIGVPGIAARAFGALHAEGLSVSTIFQASSENSIGFTLPDLDAGRALSALKAAFRAELALGLIDDVTSRAGLAVVAVVGYGMAGTPGVAARVFTALAAAEVNVIAIAQGSSERNISFVVHQADAPESLRRVHAAFRLSKIGGGRASAPPRTDVVLLGFGRVGRALADQLVSRNGAAGVRVVGLLDRSGYVFDPKGLSPRRLLRLARRKDEGHLLASLGGTHATAAAALTAIAAHAVSRPVLVDVTADETGPLLRTALAHGFDLVLANKQPLAGNAESYAELHAAARAAGRRLRYEATVGAGLPILDTHRKLVESGDRVLRIEGCVSGTLGFVLSALDEGTSFSEAVFEAMRRGFAEPDPRQDLSGKDAGRKGLILARLLGYHGRLGEPDDLTPRALRRLSLPDFLKRLHSVDEEWRERVASARLRGHVLRYVVRATRVSVRAQLVDVPAGSPIGALRGTRNLISFTTKRYRNEPLVIMGPGAGAEVTAAGILNDIHSLAAS